MKKIILALSAAAILLPGVVAPNNLASAASKNAIDQATSGLNSTGLTSGGDGKSTMTSIIQNVVNTMLFIIGALAVVMLIWGGLQYVISAGDSGKVGKAKSTILYAIVGLVIAIFSYAIVNFVIAQVGSTSGGSSTGGAAPAP